jgi:hypothetical protein
MSLPRVSDCAALPLIAHCNSDAVRVIGHCRFSREQQLVERAPARWRGAPWLLG